MVDDKTPRELVLVTGFGAFEEVVDNPSGALAEALEGHRESGLEVCGRLLPVSFGRVGAALDAVLDDLPRRPAAILCLGVQKQNWFRLESRARVQLPPDERFDVDGAPIPNEPLAADRDRATVLDVERLREALERAGAHDARVSDDAGGYVCEATYHHALRRADERGVPALFLHVPPNAAVPVERQLPLVRGLLPHLLDPSNRRS